ncbi:UNKNOWN [Stylonychia lemnae]|uniref:Uncharacterized protein n=1 Tax=Stylonychia lemnae TaxID=5949 RepID=A0A078AQS4_STYLE|nr:UNKNOWN [Stylonychia lemnae]|eukprot:CDW84569.1 UNKNOWN [Stylonychia lemnae]
MQKAIEKSYKVRQQEQATKPIIRSSSIGNNFSSRNSNQINPLHSQLQQWHQKKNTLRAIDNAKLISQTSTSFFGKDYRSHSVDPVQKKNARLDFLDSQNRDSGSRLNVNQINTHKEKNIKIREIKKKITNLPEIYQKFMLPQEDNSQDQSQMKTAMTLHHRNQQADQIISQYASKTIFNNKKKSIMNKTFMFNNNDLEKGRQLMFNETITSDFNNGEKLHHFNTFVLHNESIDENDEEKSDMTTSLKNIMEESIDFNQNNTTKLVEETQNERFRQIKEPNYKQCERLVCFCRNQGYGPCKDHQLKDPKTYEIEKVIDLIQEQMDSFSNLCDKNLDRELDYINKGITTICISRTDAEINNFKEQLTFDQSFVEDLIQKNQQLQQSFSRLQEKYESQKERQEKAFEKLSKLRSEYQLLSNENHIFRKYYQKNVLEFNKRDIYEKELDDIYTDFNKGMNMKDQFIVKNMDELERTVESFTYCKSKVLRDFINKNL